MKQAITMGVTALLLTVFAGGCTKTVYLEQETPPGTVSQVRTSSPGLEQGLQGAYQANAVVTVQEKSEEIAERFRSAYEKAQRPRIALYLNRALSDEIRQWRTDERIVIASQVKAQGALAGTLDESSRSGESQNKTLALEGKHAASGDINVSRQVHIEDAARPSGTERWSWAFEDGFSQPFLGAGANLVDRSTLLRLTAANRRDGNEVSVKQIEMEALKEYADLLVEILISNRAGTAGDYEFKVSVKDVRSGRIMAGATTLYPGNRSRSNRYVATSQGFQLQGDDPYHTGRDLALNLMDSLVPAFNNN